ncbi:MAG TPA: phosphoglycerate dehydrogenase [Nannocystaceae bacterium]|nr:phosphoglycerate dehydrogenase [Nannocystaceae bacterium]
MPRAHALLLEKVHPSADDELARGGIVVTRIDKGLDESELIAALNALPGTGPTAVGIRSKTRVTKTVIESVPRLLGIGAFCIGTDQIDLAAARHAGVAVFNAPFSSTRSVAELVMAEVVMLSRQIFPRSKAAHEGRWAKSAAGSHEIRGKVLGIVGYGHIGSQLSVLAEAFGMQVVFHDIATKLPLGNARQAATLDDVLAKSDFVSLHVPDTAFTRGMIGEAQLAKMKPESFLLNLSRGKVVDLAALREAISAGHVAGAAIDVFPQEPAGENDAFATELQGLDNVILTPHIGGSTQEAQASIGIEVAGALVKFIENGRTAGCVNLPQLDMPPPASLRGTPACRLLNVHRNIPGVLSRINHVIAQSNVNIAGQALATLEDVGLLFVDLPLAPADLAAKQLCQAIAGLDTSVRTRLVPL